MSFIWIEKPVARAIHDAQLREHGGSPGVRDEGRLESALARPLNLATYGDPGVAECAAAYGYGIARNSPFIDGNKRTAFVCIELFLALNRYDLIANDLECVTTLLALAAGDLDEAALAGWIRQHLQPR